MKKILGLLLAITVILSLTACGEKDIALGESIEQGVTRYTIVDVELGSSNYVNGNRNSEDFLTPINKDNLQVGDQFIKSLDENDGVVIVTMVVENIGKNDSVFYPFNVVVNYDDGNEYFSEKCYAHTENNSWEETERLSLEKVTSKPTTVKIVIWLPNVIIEDTASLALEFGGYTYTIR